MPQARGAVAPAASLGYGGREEAPRAMATAPRPVVAASEPPGSRALPQRAAGSAPVAWITGASSGIGQQLAAALWAAGFHVFAAARRAAPAPALAPGEAPGRAPWEALRLDVTCGRSVTDAVAHIEARAGRLDVLVNAAGFGVAGPLEETPLAAARAQMETNFFGALRCCQAALPRMRAQGRGTILNVSSIGGRLGLPFQGLYAASKFALEGLSESLRYEVAPFGVHVVLLEPGNVRSGFGAARERHGAAPHSPYHAACAAALATMERDEAGGADAGAVGRAGGRLARAARPPVRRAVGPWHEVLGLRLAAWLPRRLFDLAYLRALGLRPAGGPRR